MAAVALVAAALADPIVESLSNSGLLGVRGYDDNHLSVIPALFAGVVLFLEVAGLRCLELCRGSSPDDRDWLVTVAERFSGRSPLRDLPYVFALQLAALFGMESIEGLVVGGHIAAGLGWLGGPLVFSLAVHALIGTGCVLLFTMSMRGLLSTFATLVLRALACVIAIAQNGTTALAHRQDEPPRRRLPSPHLRQIGGRAPPALHTPA